MALITIRTCGTTTAGAQGTFMGLANQLVAQWGDNPQVYFDIEIIPEDSLFLSEGDGDYFRKRHEEVALLTRGWPPMLRRKDGKEVDEERIADDFDAKIATSTAHLHLVAINELIAELPKEEGEKIVDEICEAFGLIRPYTVAGQV